MLIMLMMLMMTVLEQSIKVGCCTDELMTMLMMMQYGDADDGDIY